MTRSWLIRGAFYGLLTAAAVVVLIPTVCRESRVPRILLEHARRMRPSVGVVEGLRFGFEVNVEAVRGARLETLSDELLRRLREGPHPVAVDAFVDAEPTLQVAFAHPSDHVMLSARLVDELGLAEVSRRPSAGRVVLRLSDASTRLLVDRKIDAAMDRIRGSMGDPCFAGEVLREGDTVVLELPGIKTTEADRVRSWIELD